MKKIVFLVLILMLSINLIGCGSSEESKTIDLSTPEGFTKLYISVVNNYEHAKATGYLTGEFNNRFVTFNDLLNELKLYDVLTEENIKKGPEVVKAKDNQAKVWYEYETGKYVKFELIKVNDIWKIGLISFWEKDKDGDPSEVTLK